VLNRTPPPLTISKRTDKPNESIKRLRSIRAFISYNQDDWSDWLGIAEFALNDKPHSSTGHTPFYLNAGQHPWKGEPSSEPTKVNAVEQLVEQMRLAREQAQLAIEGRAKQMKAAHDKRARKHVEHQQGDFVYLESTNLTSDRPSKKLDDKRYGPFKIKRKVGQSAYELELLATWKGLYPVYNEVYLTKARPPSFPSQQPPPPPPTIEVEGEEQHEVEEILKSRVQRGKIQYLVRWKGYTREDDTWEPIENVKNAPQTVRKFHDKYSNMPKPPSTTRVRGITFGSPRPLKDLTQLFDWKDNIPGEGHE